LRQQGLELPPNSIQLINFCQLASHPNWICSLSHTPNWGAAILGNSSQYRSLGIDIELKHRPVSPQVMKKISHPDDLSLEPIEIWAGKEAAFKALMNTGVFPNPVEFASIQLASNKWHHEKSGLHGEWEVRQESELVVAKSWIKN
jgi:4'-phosphopantetheinyl transferase EntD